MYKRLVLNLSFINSYLNYFKINLGIVFKLSKSISKIKDQRPKLVDIGGAGDSSLLYAFKTTMIFIENTSIISRKYKLFLYLNK